MNDVKRSISRIHLSDEQKQRMKQHIKNEQVTGRQVSKSKNYVPFVSAAFVVVAGLFLLLLQPGELLVESGEVNGSFNIAEILRQVERSHIYWAIASACFYILSMHLLRRSIIETVRWQNDPRIQEWHAFVVNKNKFWFINSTIILIYLFGTFSIFSIWVHYIVFLVVFILFYLSYTLFTIRQNVWSCCPTCGIKLTRKQIRKKTSYSAFKETCDACNSPLFLKSVAASRNSIGFIPALMIPLVNWFDYPILFIVILIASLLFIHYRFAPYMLQFADHDEQLHKKLW